MSVEDDDDEEDELDEDEDVCEHGVSMDEECPECEDLEDELPA